VAVSPALRRWASIVLAVILVGFIGWAVYREWDPFVSAVRRLTWQSLTLATLLGFVSLFANAMSWRGVMRSVGVPLPLIPALRVFGVSQLGKYVPGSVWPVLAQVELMRARGASRAHTGTASLAAMVVGIVTSAGIGTTLVIAVDEELRRQYWYVIGVVLLGAVVLLPPVLTRVLVLLERLLRRQFRPPRIGWAGMVTATAWSCAMWGAFGLHLWVLGRGLGADMLTPAQATGAFALSWVVGFLVVLAPAGVGVREAIVVLVLTPVMSEGDALALAVVSRVLLTAVDGAAGLVALILGRREAARAPGARLDRPPRDAAPPEQ